MEFCKFLILVLFNLQFLILPSFANRNFSWSHRGDITFMGKTIMFHTDENPILSLGFGTFDAFEHSGNFDITDEVTDLEDFEPKGRVDYEKDYAIITFESMMTDSDKKVGLLFEENGEISISWDHTNLQVIQFHFV